MLKKNLPASVNLDWLALFVEATLAIRVIIIAEERIQINDLQTVNHESPTDRKSCQVQPCIDACHYT